LVNSAWISGAREKISVSEESQEHQAEGNVQPTTVPRQPEIEAPLRKKFPLVIGLAGIILLFGLVNLVNLLTGKKSEPPRSSMPVRPSTANPQQVSSFENQQALEAQRDARQRARQKQIADQMRELQEEQQAMAPGPEAEGMAPMTPAQSTAIYGDNNPNAPKRTSGIPEAQAEAKQRALAREKQHQDAINSDTVALDFARGENSAGTAAPTSDQNVGANTGSPNLAGLTNGVSPVTGSLNNQAAASATARERKLSPNVPSGEGSKSQPEEKDPAVSRHDFDGYTGNLYLIFEGTFLEGVVTNRIDGEFKGPILVMMTTDYYSHDHEQLLLPQGTRLIGDVQSVSSGQQRKLIAVFHRAVCPDGFSIDFDNFTGLDPRGTTGLATKVNNHYLSTFAAAAAIGGLGGLAQIGNGGIGVLGGDPSVLIRDGISAQTSQEAEQILNHFLNRLPVITLKEGSRARIYITRDILVPAYSDHRIAPDL
jgi:type IV secretory pathway VirB10-like protein